MTDPRQVRWEGFEVTKDMNIKYVNKYLPTKARKENGTTSNKKAGLN